MGAAYFIVSEEPLEGFDTFVDGKALAHASDQLDALAEAAGVRPLMDFFSMDPEEVDAIFDDLLAAEGEFGDLEAGLADEDEDEEEPAHPAGPNGTASTPPSPDAPDADHPLAESLAAIAAEETPPEEWYPAAEGLATVHALIAAVEALPEPESPDPNAVDPPPSAILADLRAFAAVLEHLQAANIRWHLAVDF